MAATARFIRPFADFEDLPLTLTLSLAKRGEGTATAAARSLLPVHGQRHAPTFSSPQRGEGWVRGSPTL